MFSISAYRLRNGSRSNQDFMVRSARLGVNAVVIFHLPFSCLVTFQTRRAPDYFATSVPTCRPTIARKRISVKAGSQETLPRQLMRYPLGATLRCRQRGVRVRTLSCEAARGIRSFPSRERFFRWKSHTSSNMRRRHNGLRHQVVGSLVHSETVALC